MANPLHMKHTHTRYSLLSLSFSRYSCSRRMHAVCDRHLVVDRLHSVKLKNKSETVGFWYRFELIIILSFFSTKRQPKKCGWQQRECNARAKKVKEEWRTAPDDSLDLKKQKDDMHLLCISLCRLSDWNLLDTDRKTENGINSSDSFRMLNE